MDMQLTTETELEQFAIQLFQKFARIEYALKAAGFHNGDGPAMPNWNKFASSVPGVFENDPAIAAAVKYMIEKPPKKQMIRDDLLEWEDQAPNANKTDEILLCVRRVRNNLFHGGKFNGHWFEPERSKELLMYSLSILDACLRASPALKEAFDNDD